MLDSLKDTFNNLFGTRHDREVARLQPLVDEINVHAERLESLSEEELKAQTKKFREIIRERTGSLETELTEFRATKKSTEDAGERDRLNRQINAGGHFSQENHGDRD